MARKNRTERITGDKALNGEIRSFTDIVTINNLTPETAEFYITDGGFLGLKENGEDKGRVGIYRMTPINDPNRHLSVRDTETNELGIIFDLNVFPEDQRKIIETDIILRYFTPEITEITDIKEEYGYTFIKAETSAGFREFTMREMSYNIIFLSPTSCFLTDTDGNRYLISDIRKMSDKVTRIIGVWA